MITDKQRIDWLQKHGRDGWSLISDEKGKWAVSIGGMSILPNEPRIVILKNGPIVLEWKKSFIIERSEWRATVRKAIDRAIKVVK